MKNYIKTLVVFCVCVISLPSFASNLQYAIIIDAGSSGSRAHIFEYTPSQPMNTVPMINDFFVARTSPGLSFYANNPDAAGPALKPALDAVAIELQRKGVDLSQVPVSVLATAGMRMLPASQQEAIYASVRNYIHTNYIFSLNDNNVRTITGMMEGVYGWLDVNYLQNGFSNPLKTVGSIDMGGASTQIAFATTDTSQPEHEIELTINNTLYRIYSRSFLGLGENQSLSTMKTYTDAPGCFPSGYTSDSFTGNFIFSSCSNIYSNIIDHFGVKQNMVSTAGTHFIASDGIYNNFSFFNIEQTPTQNALESRINAVCYQPWSALQKLYPNNANLANDCANGVYFDELLFNAYQLQGDQLTLAEKINGTYINWTLGALLYTLVQ